jgi:hypothetical protein
MPNLDYLFCDPPCNIVTVNDLIDASDISQERSMLRKFGNLFGHFEFSLQHSYKNCVKFRGMITTT